VNVPNGKLRVTQELCGSGELWLAGGEPRHNENSERKAMQCQALAR
jgi:hypothetical protein